MNKQDLPQLVPGAKLTIGRPSDAEDCLDLRSATTLDLEHEGKPELCLAQESPEEFSAFFNDAESQVLVLRDASGKLVGFGIATYRGESLQHFRTAIPDFDAAPRRAGYIKLIQIAKPYRGLRLQQLFFTELEEWLKSRGTVYACGTVSPDNIPSYRNFLHCGYVEADRFTHEGSGYARVRMIKNI